MDEILYVTVLRFKVSCCSGITNSYHYLGIKYTFILRYIKLGINKFWSLYLLNVRHCINVFNSVFAEFASAERFSIGILNILCCGNWRIKYSAA